MACILGVTGEVYFPKLRKEQVMTFSNMASCLLAEMGYEVDLCKSETEAISKAGSQILKTKRYPVYYSGSDTTGEKPYEEFFTETEITDIYRHKALGVVTNIESRPENEILGLLDQLETAFENIEVCKADIVEIMRNFLVNFDHKETGKTLDAKM